MLNEDIMAKNNPQTILKISCILFIISEGDAFLEKGYRYLLNDGHNILNETKINVSLFQIYPQVISPNFQSIIHDIGRTKTYASSQNFLKQQNALFEGTISEQNMTLTLNACVPNTTHTCQEAIHAPQFSNQTLIKGIILCTISVFSFLGNIATLSSILKSGRQGTSTVYMLLLQLAVADLLVTLFCILTEGFWTLTVQWLGGNILCKSIKFLQMFSLYLSTFLLVLIGFDRLCAVRFPMQRINAKRHVRRGIICIWIVSAAFSLPQLFIFSVMKGPFIEEFFQCVTYAFYTALWQEQIYTTLTLVLMFLLPLFILVATYITTFLTIASRQNMFSERVSRTALGDARHKILQKAKVKSLMITVVIVLTFVVCWTPYYVMMIIFMFLDPDEQLSQDLQSAIFFFGSSTALLNPVIYGAFHLRTPRRTTRSKSTSFINHSTTSKMDHSIMSSLRRSQVVRKNNEELGCFHTNGLLCAPSTSQRKHKPSLVNSYGSSLRKPKNNNNITAF